MECRSLKVEVHEYFYRIAAVKRRAVVAPAVCFFCMYLIRVYMLTLCGSSNIHYTQSRKAYIGDFPALL